MMVNTIDDLSVNLEKQYKGFRVLFWTDLVLAVILILTGALTTGMLLVIFAMVLAGIANQKLVLINQRVSLNNQELIMTKLEVSKRVAEVPYV